VSGALIHMSPTRIRNLTATVVICAAVAWLLLRIFYTSLPPLPWTGVPAMLLLAVAEAWIGRSLRLRLRGKNKGLRIEPIAVARLAALAKASSLAGALIAGLAAGFLIYVSGSLGKPVFRSDAYAAGGTLAAALVLVAAALYLEYGCRVPTSKEPGEPPSEDGP
jgi:Protein of unknown function (DUF3180)